MPQLSATIFIAPSCAVFAPSCAVFAPSYAVFAPSYAVIAPSWCIRMLWNVRYVPRHAEACRICDQPSP